MKIDIFTDKNYIEGRKLLEEDKLSYAVLYNVLGSDVKKIITDHKRFMIAHTAKVYPTWIWAPDDVSEQELDEIYQFILKEFSPVDDYRFNTKYEIAKYLMKRLGEEGIADFGISANIVAYECHEAIMPTKKAEGFLEQLKESDLDLAAKLIEEASLAIGDRVMVHEESIEAAKEQLQHGVLYVWRNKAGKAVSFCDKNKDNHYVKISQCYTPKEERGKSYAAWMIYELCRDCLKENQIPMLYADGDYESSNRCYQKIGFELKGRIAMIGRKK